MKTSIQWRQIVRESLLTYFAPLTGAIKGIRAELGRIDSMIEKRRSIEHVLKSD
ncbi:MAG: hypothetical protein ACREBU_17795 [Nitrososphaera sp.]